MRMLKAFLISFLVLSTAFGETFTAKVVRVIDGDTIVVLTEQNEQIRVRLHGIDAPEKGEPYSKKATELLSSLVAGKAVEIRKTGKDRYHRTLGVVLLDGKDINAQMVASGLAVAFIKYSKDYTKQEQDARNKRIGLWQVKA